MKVTIIVKPEELWDYYSYNKSRLSEVNLEIAESLDDDICMFITERYPEFPEIVVYRYGIVVCEEAFNATNAEEICENLFYLYFGEDYTDDDCEGFEENEESFFEQQDAIEERELELNSAVIDFIETVIDDSFSEVPYDIIEDCKEHFLNYLSKVHGIKNIYRPMVLECDDGDELFTENPYEVTEFDDEYIK